MSWLVDQLTWRCYRSRSSYWRQRRDRRDWGCLTSDLCTALNEYAGSKAGLGEAVAPATSHMMTCAICFRQADQAKNVLSPPNLLQVEYELTGSDLTADDRCTAFKGPGHHDHGFVRGVAVALDR